MGLRLPTDSFVGDIKWTMGHDILGLCLTFSYQHATYPANDASVRKTLTRYRTRVTLVIELFDEIIKVCQ